jgi:alpha-amylase
MIDLVLNHMAGGYNTRYNYNYQHNTFEKLDASGGNSSNNFNTATQGDPFHIDKNFGEAGTTADINHGHPHMRSGLKNWGNWISSKVGYGAYRWDVSYYIDPWFISEFMNYGQMRGKFAVMEGWELADQLTIREMETYVALTDYRSAMFDMPLKKKLKDMCNEPSLFNMESLNGGGFYSVRPDFTVTFVENHDTIRANGNPPEYDKFGIITNKELAYAYILTAEGYPCIFYHDYLDQPYADSTNGWRGTPLKDKIDPLISVRTNYAAGNTSYLSVSNKQYLYIARRNGDGAKPGCIFVLNNHTNQNLFNTISTVGIYTNGSVLLDYLNPSHSITVTAGTVTLGASNRNYRVYIKQ